ncbi:MAG: MFS transporter [Hylemonella sp.]|uniref:MFS transporter n=1 Tax=Hylemonella sp. TaxID=2066020 RepID=UPI0022CD051A|nr:MFS transporter [Hylemonella sp.]MCZ8253386.1 MFS transporter [Hylemonella sp.]
MSVLGRRPAVVVFLVFAFAYFFSALVRSVTATLSPQLTQEFALSARDLGLLAGGYFLGFAALQLPLGQWLDRHGPRNVVLGFLAVAVAGCAAFAMSQGFTGLLLARVLCGVGLGACLMAPLTGYRRWFDPVSQLRANSWMLMTGSMGMVASTLPVQWLLPQFGWRPIFWGLAALLLLAMLLIAWRVPGWTRPADAAEPAARSSYAEVWRDPYFRRMTPVGFFNYGGMVAIQTLWAVPWMVRVAGYTPVQAATNLFWINVAMLCTFWSWGLLVPRLTQRGIQAQQLIAWGTPLSLLVLGSIVFMGERWAGYSGWLWALFCVSSTFLSLAQPAVGMAFPSELAGRALSAYNLVIFAGVFVVQWGIGLLIDALEALGWSTGGAFRGAMAVFLLLNLASYAYFLAAKRP